MPPTFPQVLAVATPRLQKWLRSRRAAVTRVLGRVAPSRLPPRPKPAVFSTPAEANAQTAKRWIARTKTLQAALQAASSPRDLRLPDGWEVEDHRFGRSISFAVFGPAESDLPRIGGVAQRFFWTGDVFPTPASAFRSLADRVDTLARFDSPKTVLAERRKGTLREAWNLLLLPE